jgi:hypothetical protein
MEKIKTEDDLNRSPFATAKPSPVALKVLDCLLLTYAISVAKKMSFFKFVGF